jgi:hypothetical protein
VATVPSFPTQNQKSNKKVGRCAASSSSPFRDHPALESKTAFMIIPGLENASDFGEALVVIAGVSCAVSTASTAGGVPVFGARRLQTSRLSASPDRNPPKKDRRSGWSGSSANALTFPVR